MTCDDLHLLIDYNYWGRDRILAAVAAITQEQFLRPMGNSFGSIRDTLAHICGAERVWITRLKGEAPMGLPASDRIPDLESLRREWAALEAAMRDLLAGWTQESIERTIDYRDLRGNPQSDPVWQVIQHLVNHCTYHRGQIVTLLRQMDAAPPASMDLITFYRERNRMA